MKLLKYGYYVYQVAYTIEAEIYVFKIYMQGLKKIYVRTSTIISSGSNTLSLSRPFEVWDHVLVLKIFRV